MAERTTIEWCDSTGNLEMGCDGCEVQPHCYAETLTARRAGQRGWPERFDRPRIFPERLAGMLRWRDLTGPARPDKPWLDGLPRLIFLNDMGDTFTESLPVDWLAPYLPAMASSPHQWLILTKRPHRFAQFAARHPLPRNIWAGASITSAANVGRLKALVTIPARIRFVSAEPLRGPVDLTPHLSRVHWVIAGGESGPGYCPVDPAWLRDVRDQCVAAGVPFFFKQWGGKIPKAGGKALDGREWCEMPKAIG